MAVRYFRECIDGAWVDVRLSDEELNKLRRATVRSSAKCLKLVKEEVAALASEAEPITVSPAESMVMLQKIAPTYTDVVSDYIRNKVWVKNHPEAAAKKPEAAAAK